MSGKFTGITFAKQKVKPSDDAIVRRAILSDGILTGCAMSYSGSTLKMGAGHLLVCGRQIAHPSADNWAVIDATSGYARLLLTIDLTRTSAKDMFDQVIDTIEYSETFDGFSNLNQSDVNGEGTQYEFVACIVSLGSGGITGIVYQADHVASATNPVSPYCVEKLWENPSLTSEFVAQVIALDLAEYDGVEIVCYADETTNIYFNSGYLPKGLNSVLSYTTASNGYRLHREFLVNSDGVDFKAGTNTGSIPGNKVCIPYQIYGVKGICDMTR